MTTIYLIRHSKTLKTKNDLNTDNLQLQNEKYSLSLEGEQIAYKKLNNKLFMDIDVLYSSNYVRSIQTAKYIADKNNLEINVVSDLGERKFGISSWDELPSDFEKKQFLDENYKIGSGESQKEVIDRMYSTIIKIINKNTNKNIAIVSHGTAIMFLLKKWCDVQFINNKYKCSFNSQMILNGHPDFCETFKLEFNDYNKLVEITNINSM